MVTLDDYNIEGAGFMGGEREGQEQLLKAMQAGQITGEQTLGLSLTQEPLKAESLEQTLKLIEFRLTDIKLWNEVPKLTAYNTVEEFLQLASYGTQRGGFYDEGELSDVEDSSYIRKSEQVKYMQVTGEVTMQAQMVRSFVDAMRKETENKMMWILRLANTSLTKADSNIIPQQFNSYYAQHQSIGSGANFLYLTFEDYYNSNVVVDLRGASLKQGDIENASVAIDSNYGTADRLFAPSTVVSAFAQDYFKVQRILQGGAGFEGKIGTVPKTVSSTLGDIGLVSDKFMKADPARNLANPATSVKAPTAPSAVSVSLNADPLVKYSASPSSGLATELGNVFYGVSSLNRYGESNITAYATPVTLAAGQRPDITITPGVGPLGANGYVIYRTKITAAGSPTGLTFYPIFKVSTSDVAGGYNGAAAGVVGDRGYFLPDMEQAFMIESNEDVYSFKQLAPISKLDLAILSMSRRFITFLFGTPQLYTPKKMLRFINVSRTLAGTVNF